jgi:hypothetical protein
VPMCAADAVRSALKHAVEEELVSKRLSYAPEAFSKSTFSKSHGIAPEATYAIHFAEADSGMNDPARCRKKYFVLQLNGFADTASCHVSRKSGSSFTAVNHA